jgi:hypothetical protein
MFEDEKGPVQHFSWGRFIVSGKEHSKTEKGKTGKGKDIRLIGSKVSRWKERKGHELDVDMVTGVFDQDIEVLIIGSGVHGMVSCPEHVINSIRKKGIRKVIVEKTPEACRLYNKLFHEGIKVALLAHGTC